MFGNVPSPSDYSVSYEEYLDAMCKALDKKKQLYEIIPLKNAQIDRWTN